eukprot:TRINITY_DN5737_c0_g3_i1.p1 TRINITY_DN5737_c0_g3~~TRINITY_DN5737_c0_g3_i1.p1  ORF type:complete len:120 (-),score=34.30 TRINITY_DN5737_c0_g3_i1:222-581(-)
METQNDEGFAEQIGRLKELLGIKDIPFQQSESQQLISLLKIIQRHIKNQSNPNVTSSMEEFPLGFSTGDPQVDQAATLLRLLYNEDNRDLQHKINEMIVHNQSFTCDPKTNFTQGKVGR